MVREYRGQRYDGGNLVEVSEAGTWVGLLNPRFEVRNHSPTGFEWGYCGSGPAQLALALLCDALADERIAEWWYQDYKREVVAGWQKEGWKTTREAILAWLVKKMHDELHGDGINLAEMEQAEEQQDG